MAVNYGAAQGSKLLSSVSKKQEELLNAAKIVSIPNEAIVPNPDNAKIFNMRNIDGLVQSIRENGFIGAIEVYDIGGGKYEIASGHRRHAANKIVGNKTIPAIILPKADAVTKAKKLISSNIYNRELTPLDKARAIEYYIEKVLKTDPSYEKANITFECAHYFNISETQVKYLRRMVNLDPSLQELIENGSVSYTGLIDAYQLSPEEQREVAQTLASYAAETDGGELTVARTKQVLSNVISRLKKAAQANDDMGEQPDKKTTVETADEGDGRFVVDIPVAETPTKQLVSYNKSSSVPSSFGFDEGFVPEDDIPEEEEEDDSPVGFSEVSMDTFKTAGEGDKYDDAEDKLEKSMRLLEAVSAMEFEKTMKVETLLEQIELFIKMIKDKDA